MGCTQSQKNSKKKLDYSNDNYQSRGIANKRGEEDKFALLLTLTEKRRQLMNATYKETPKYTIKNYKTWAKVIRIYDGDSCYVALFIEDKMVKIPCRLQGIDTAEIRSDNPREVMHAKRAKEFLTNIVSDKLMWVHIHKTEKFGRYLTTLYNNKTESINVSQLILGAGLGYEYNGGKKVEFDDWFDPNKFE